MTMHGEAVATELRLGLVRDGRVAVVGAVAVATRRCGGAARAADAALRGTQHLGDQQVAAGAHLRELVPLGLGQEVDRAQLQGLQCHLGPFLRQGTDHHHRYLVDGQDRRQRIQTRDLRHLHVERDHVRLEPQRLDDRLAAVAREAGDLDLRRRAQQIRQ